jgi:hypothetical protein
LRKSGCPEIRQIRSLRWEETLCTRARLMNFYADRKMVARNLDSRVNGRRPIAAK